MGEEEARQEFAFIKGEKVPEALAVEQPQAPGKAPFVDLPRWDETIQRDVPKDQPVGDKRMAENEPGAKKADKNPSVDEQLDKLVAFSYPRITLERAVQRVSAEIHVPVTIISRDLTQAGISRHHAIQLEVYLLSASECLQHILSLVDRSGRLTFVLRTRPDGREEIAITTHAGIAERIEGRPGEF